MKADSFEPYFRPLHLPPELEDRRSYFQSVLVQAQHRLFNFAGQHGWRRHLGLPLFKQTEIFAVKRLFDDRMKQLCAIAAETELPPTYSAALEQECLIAVSPELFLEHYPEGFESDYYEKVLTHELAHRLHIRILEGVEEAMGPIWFFEGFAIVASGQFENDRDHLDKEEIIRLLEKEERTSYRLYGRLIRTILAKCPLAELVDRARSTDFTEWVRQLVACKK